MSIATVFTLSAGEIDLSIGSVVGLTALTAAVVTRDVGVLLGLTAAISELRQ